MSICHFLVFSPIFTCSPQLYSKSPFFLEMLGYVFFDFHICDDQHKRVFRSHGEVIAGNNFGENIFITASFIWGKVVPGRRVTFKPSQL